MSFLDAIVSKLLTQDRLARLDLRNITEEDRNAALPLVEFFCEPQWRGVLPEPKLAMHNIASWWKKIPMDLKQEHMPNPTDAIPRDHLGAPAMTAKRCIPLLDGMSIGYTLFTATDIAVKKIGKHMEIQPNPRYAGASMHDVIQLGGKTSPTYPGPAIKFHNPYVIKTRPGYSTLFVPPINHVEEDRFICLGAAVDTDVYPKQVNFPAVMLKDFDGIIPAGTPIITAIVYRRKDVEREIIVRGMHAAEQHLIEQMTRRQDTRSHMYTEELRERRK